MVTRILCVAATLLGGILFSGLPASAQEPFDDAEREAIEKIIHEYLIEHPEVIPEAIQVLQAREDAQQLANMRAAAREHRDELEHDSFSGVMGNPDGAVTVVEFFDYQCPFCRRAHDDVMRLVADNDDVRLVVKQFPIKDVPNEPPVSLMGAYMALSAVKQGKFAEFHEQVNQTPFPLSEDKLRQAAAAVGLDISGLEAEMQSQDYISAVRQTYELARTLGVNATPTFFIGEVVVIGARGYDALLSAVKAERAAQASASR